MSVYRTAQLSVWQETGRWNGPLNSREDSIHSSQTAYFDARSVPGPYVPVEGRTFPKSHAHEASPSGRSSAISRIVSPGPWRSRDFLTGYQYGRGFTQAYRTSTLHFLTRAEDNCVFEEPQYHFKCLKGLMLLNPNESNGQSPKISRIAPFFFFFFWFGNIRESSSVVPTTSQASPD